MITSEQIETLNKYNIKYEGKDIHEILELLDEEILKYLDKKFEPTIAYLELEKIYDEIHDHSLISQKNK